MMGHNGSKSSNMNNTAVFIVIVSRNKLLSLAQIDGSDINFLFLVQSGILRVIYAHLKEVNSGVQEQKLMRISIQLMSWNFIERVTYTAGPLVALASVCHFHPSFDPLRHLFSSAPSK